MAIGYEKMDLNVNKKLADLWAHQKKDKPYRWVMMAVWFMMMTINSISLTNYALALPAISKEYNIQSGTLLYYAGILSYSLGLFVIYFVNKGGWLDTKVKYAIIFSQLAVALPSFIIPFSNSYSEIVFLRFIQGLWFMELALATIHLKGWFGKKEVSYALAAPLSALVVGSAIGGIIEKEIVTISTWQTGYIITWILTVIGSIVFIIFYRDSKGYNEYINVNKAERKEMKGKHNCPPSWKLLIAYTIGFSQIATTMAFASIPYLVPVIEYRIRYSEITVSNTVFIYGMLAALMTWAGAALGSLLVSRHSAASDVFRARNKTRTISYIIGFAGFLLLLYLHYHVIYFIYLIGAILAASILFNIPNYWAEMGEVVPESISGDFIFFSGAVASSGFFLGPLITILLIVTYKNIMAAILFFLIIILISEILNIYQNHLKLPVDMYQD